MAHWAKPGVRCVCIHDGAWASDPDGRDLRSGPAKGDVLVIALAGWQEAEFFLGFAEWGDGRVGFRASGFRPLIISTQDDDVALFEPLLHQNSIHVPESV